jgi:hypothetical protein
VFAVVTASVAADTRREGGINLWRIGAHSPLGVSRAHFFSAPGLLIVFPEIKEIKRQDKAELLQDVGPESLIDLRFQRPFSAIYFQTAFLPLVECRHGEGD